MPSIISIGLGRPEGYYEQERVFKALGHRPVFWPLFEKAGIKGRPLYAPPEVIVSRTPQEQQDAYFEAVMKLSKKAIIEALDRGNTGPEEIKCFVCVSCTGFPPCPSFPSILAGELGFPPDCLHLPLMGMGCQGSGPGLRTVYDFLRTRPKDKAICLSVEISNASYHPKTIDDRKVNRGVILGNAIFSDGAGCALLSGREDGLSIIDFDHYTVYTYKDKIGLDIIDNRYRLRLATDVPELVSGIAKERVLHILKKAGLKTSEISYFIVHSGGSTIIDQVQKALDLTDEQVRFSWETWHEVGNLSSATVMFALEKLLSTNVLKKGDWVIIVTLGAGIECDCILCFFNK